MEMMVERARQGSSVHPGRRPTVESRVAGGGDPGGPGRHRGRVTLKARGRIPEDCGGAGVMEDKGRARGK